MKFLIAFAMAVVAVSGQDTLQPDAGGAAAPAVTVAAPAASASGGSAAAPAASASGGSAAAPAAAASGSAAPAAAASGSAAPAAASGSAAPAAASSAAAAASSAAASSANELTDDDGYWTRRAAYNDIPQPENEKGSGPEAEAARYRHENGLEHHKHPYLDLVQPDPRQKYESTYDEKARLHLTDAKDTQAFATSEDDDDDAEETPPIELACPECATPTLFPPADPNSPPAGKGAEVPTF